MRPAVVLLLLLLGLLPARPAPAADPPPVPTITSLAVLADAPENAAVAWAMAEDRAGRFRSLPDTTYTAPGDAPRWLRLTLDVPPEVDSAAFGIDLNWPFLRLLEWFVPGRETTAQTTPGEWNLYLPAPFPLPPGLHGETVVYVRLAGYGNVNINPVIVRQADAARLTALRPWLLGLFFGLMGSMLLYNLFLFASLRDASYGHYVANVALLLVYYTFSSGLVTDFFPAPSQQDYALFLDCLEITSALMFANMGFFTRSFLLTRRAAPVIDRILSGQIVVSLLLLPLVLLGPQHRDLSFLFGPLVGMFTAVTISLAAVVRMLQGFRPAAVFGLGWGTYVACGFVHSMTWAGLTTATPVAIHALMAGTAAEVFIMSLALAYRVKLLRDHALLAEQERSRLSMEKALSDEARDSLARENTLLSMILDDHRFGIGVVQDGRFQFANRQLARHLGREELLGQPLAAVPQALDFLGNSLEMPGDRDSAREVTLGENGSGRSLRAVGRCLDPARPEMGTVFIVEDVSEARRLETLKNDIDQIMRHDLKSPLATIAGIQEALKLAGPLTEGQRRLTAMLERTVSEMTSRINLSLNLYKMETGSFRLTPQPLSLARLLEDARLELAPALSFGGRIDLVYEAPPEAFTVLGERLLLVSLLVNVLRNAVEAAANAGPVVVTVSDPAAPRVAIVNPGEVPPGIRHRFFEKYATAGKPGGTGLGTYSARLIARTFGGDVQVDFSRPGQTTVTVTGLQPSAPDRAGRL
ncbi:7TM diverse intracellular signaling domain-containing protein [Solidesulfovibrio sp.]